MNGARLNELNKELNSNAELGMTFTYQFKVSDIIVPNETHYSSEFDYKDFRWSIFVKSNSNSEYLAGYLECDGPFDDWILKTDFDFKLLSQTHGTADRCFKFTDCEFNKEGRSPFTREIYQMNLSVCLLDS